MTDREINEKISEWAGLPCKCEADYWGSCPMHERGNEPRPYLQSDNEAMTLLSVLVEKGHEPCLYFRQNLWTCNVNAFSSSFGLGIKPTIASAICMAVLGVIERYNGAADDRGGKQ